MPGRSEIRVIRGLFKKIQANSKRSADSAYLDRNLEDYDDRGSLESIDRSFNISLSVH
jgi:hypothetical protein